MQFRALFDGAVLIGQVCACSARPFEFCAWNMPKILLGLTSKESVRFVVRFPSFRPRWWVALR